MPLVVSESMPRPSSGLSNWSTTRTPTASRCWILQIASERLLKKSRTIYWSLRMRWIKLHVESTNGNSDGKKSKAFKLNKLSYTCAWLWYSFHALQSWPSRIILATIFDGKISFTMYCLLDLWKRKTLQTTYFSWRASKNWYPVKSTATCVYSEYNK
jgi:hypothetical protein